MPPMLKLHRLKIMRFRSVRPCELIFHDGLNVLLGKNGSGKTTLLRLIADLYSRPLGEIAPGEEFELEVEFHFAVGSVTTRIKGTLASQDAPSGLSTGESGGSRGYEIDLRITFSSFQLQAQKAAQEPGFRVIRDGHLMNWSLSLEALNVLGLMQSFISGTPPFSLEGELRLKLYEDLWAATLPFRFDESLEALDLIRKKRISFNAAVPPLSTGQSVFIHLSEGPWPKGYRERFEAAISQIPDAQRIDMDEKQLECLRRFVELTGLRSARMIAERIEKKKVLNRVSREIFQNTFSNFHFSFTRRDGSEFPQEQLSYGQKRLLTFLYCQSAIPQVMIADELVNGLHHDWIESCVDLLRDRQAFLSSQNPLLLDHLWFESQEEIRKTFILCSSEQEADRDVLTWKNMSPEEAEVVHRAYQTGVQHVSEILHSQGLW
jgi:energy-coupling factor transporter ATP-binding protein EcfA2